MSGPLSKLCSPTVCKHSKICSDRQSEGCWSSAVLAKWVRSKGLCGCDLPAKYSFIFYKNELNNLVLVDHVHRHICGFHLRSQERWAKHDCYTLIGHSVLIWVLYYSANRIRERISIFWDRSYYVSILLSFSCQNMICCKQILSKVIESCNITL